MNPEDVSRFANMLNAMGTESRLRIMRLLLSSHPHGLAGCGKKAVVTDLLNPYYAEDELID